MSSVETGIQNNTNDSQNLHVDHEPEQVLFEGYIRTIQDEILYMIHIPIIQLLYHFFYIGGMETLKTRRDTALEITDNESVFDIEQLIFHKACITRLTSSHQTMLETVLNSWFPKDKDEYDTEQYRNCVVQCTEQCLWNDNVEILQIIITKGKYKSLLTTKKACFTFLEKRRMNEIICFINLAIIYNAFECVKYLLQNDNKLDWTNEYLPDILLNAIKYQNKNVNFIHFVIDELEKTDHEIAFINKNKCHDIMEQCIQFDLLDIAKRIVSKGWHEISENDKSFAQYLNNSSPNKCYEWMNERSRDFLNVINCNSMQIELDDSGWDCQTSDEMDQYLSYENDNLSQ